MSPGLGEAGGGQDPHAQCMSPVLGRGRAGCAMRCWLCRSQPQPWSCFLSPELPAPVRMEPAKLPPSKRMAPAPPVPAKAKPAPTLASK